MLPWREAEVGGEVAARAEAVDVADEGQESRRVEYGDAWHTHEEGGLRQLLGQAVELVLQRRGLGLEGGDLLEHLGERVAQVAGKALLGERGAGAGQHLGGAEGDSDAELAQVSPQRIDAGGAGLEIAPATLLAH